MFFLATTTFNFWHRATGASIKISQRIFDKDIIQFESIHLDRYVLKQTNRIIGLFSNTVKQQVDLSKDTHFIPENIVA